MSLQELTKIPGWAAIRRIIAHDGLTPNAREQYEAAERRRESFRRLRRFRYGSMALDAAKVDLSVLLPKHGVRALYPCPYDPNGFETQCVWALQMGLMGLLGPPAPEETFDMADDDDLGMERA